MEVGNLLKKLARGTGWAFAGLTGLVVALSAVGASYQAYATHRDEIDLEAPGVMVDVGGHRLHMDCRGSGDITLILDAGAQLWSSSWRWVHQDLAADYRVCAYDRSGLGWSERGTGTLDLITAADELHRLLEASGEAGPFVHVGHSLGGTLARVHHQRYPDDFAAAVMIDPGEPEILIEDFQAERGAPVKSCGTTCHIQLIAAHLGVTRIVLDNLELLDDPSYPADAVVDFRARLALPERLRTLFEIGYQLPRAFFQALDAPRIADIPVLVLYSGNHGELVSEGETEAEMARWRGAYEDAWRATATASTDGIGPVEIPGANHITVIVGESYARQVSSEIRAFVAGLR